MTSARRKQARKAKNIPRRKLRVQAEKTATLMQRIMRAKEN